MVKFKKLLNSVGQLSWLCLDEVTTFEDGISTTKSFSVDKLNPDSYSILSVVENRTLEKKVSVGSDIVFREAYGDTALTLRLNLSTTQLFIHSIVPWYQSYMMHPLHIPYL
jgi:hypothetical protein